MPLSGSTAVEGMLKVVVEEWLRLFADNPILSTITQGGGILILRPEHRRLEEGTRWFAPAALPRRPLK